MATQTEDGSGVEGRAAVPVYVKNLTLPSSAPTGTQNVAVTSALPAGDNNIGNVDLASAIPAGTNNIGDVDIASAPTGASAQQAQGTAADGAAAVGNPVQVAGKDGSGNVQALRTFTDGAQYVILVNTLDSSPSFNQAGAADGNSTTFVLQMAGAYQFQFNGTNWDRVRNNANTTILASAARTATTNSADQTNHNGRRLLLAVNVSNAGTGSITPSLQIKDSISGNYVTVWTAAAAVTTVTTTTYYFADGAATAAGDSFTEVRSIGLASRDWRVVVTHNNANSITYSVSGVVLL